jgi:crossover junction endodeoxyribonuclease RuvC
VVRQPTRILGIDPGSRITGWGVIESDGQRSRHLQSGHIRTGNGAFTDRLGEIFAALNSVVAELRPEEAAVEQVFMAHNAASALKLGQARGAAIAAVVHRAVPVFEYSARAVKLAATGTGGAAKEQVEHMVRLMLSLRDELQADQADALAVALCHAHHRSTLLRQGRTGS